MKNIRNSLKISTKIVQNVQEKSEMMEQTKIKKLTMNIAGIFKNRLSMTNKYSDEIKFNAAGKLFCELRDLLA